MTDRASQLLETEDRDGELVVTAPLREASGDSGSVGCSVLLFFAFAGLVGAMFYLIISTFDPNDLGALGSLYIFIPALGMISILLVSALLSAPRFKRLVVRDVEWRVETYAKRLLSSEPRQLHRRSVVPAEVGRLEIVEGHHEGRPVLVAQGGGGEIVFGDILASRLSGQTQELAALREELEALVERLRV